MSPASATTRRPSSASRSSRSPARTTAWSSARTMVISSPWVPSPSSVTTVDVKPSGRAACGFSAIPARSRPDVSRRRARHRGAMTTHQHQGHDPLRVVIAGGGVAALEAMIGLRAASSARVDITLVSASDTFAYRPLAVGEPFGLGHPARYPLARLCQDHSARFVHARVEQVRPGDHQVELDDGSVLDYD